MRTIDAHCAPLRTIDAHCAPMRTIDAYNNYVLSISNHGIFQCMREINTSSVNGISLYRLRLINFESIIHSIVLYRFGVSIGSNTPVYYGTVKYYAIGTLFFCFCIVTVRFRSVPYNALASWICTIPYGTVWYGTVQRHLYLIGVLRVIDPVEVP